MCKLFQSLLKSVWQFFREFGINVPQDPLIPLLGIYKGYSIIPEGHLLINIHSSIFIIARTWKQPRSLSNEEWIRKIWYIYTMKYNSAAKNNDIIKFANV